METIENNKLSQKQFNKYCELIKTKLGISVSNAKFDMIEGKLVKLSKKSGINCFDEYYNFILSNNNGAWGAFVDEITIHKTNFFREDNHFNFLKTNISQILEQNPRILLNNELRVWSSACSSGEEAYTIAMVLSEYVPPNIKIKILATDISEKVIKEAQIGEYTLDSEDLINNYYLSKYFTKNSSKHCILEDLKKLITFRTFNLMNNFPFQNSFDIIFCRNVMIYFDNTTQEELINKFYDVTVKNGLLFIGHSETLNQKQHKFKYVQPTIYKKI